MVVELGEIRRRHSLATAVRPDFVVVLVPELDGRSGLLERLGPLFIWALVPELAVEALDVAVLYGPSRLDRDVTDAGALRPAYASATSCEASSG